MSENYAPFPTEGLEINALFFEEQAQAFGALGIDGDALLVSAEICRSAIASYKALNERCLRAELERDHGVKG